MSKILTVFGATGIQGGPAAWAVFNYPQLSKEYKVRSVTRDATKPASKTLEEKGIDVIGRDYGYHYLLTPLTQ
jgi:uncharacterized protein YbjT (DUF2867 family)